VGRRNDKANSSCNRTSGSRLIGSLVEGIADAFATFISRYGGFFRSKTRDSAAVAARYLRGLAQAQGKAAPSPRWRAWLTRVARNSSSISSVIRRGITNLCWRRSARTRIAC
jgi:hypothetical protein